MFLAEIIEELNLKVLTKPKDYSSIPVKRVIVPIF